MSEAEQRTYKLQGAMPEVQWEALGQVMKFVGLQVVHTEQGDELSGQQPAGQWEEVGKILGYVGLTMEPVANP